MMKFSIKKAFLPLVALCSATAANADIVLNEAMPCNLNTYMDKDTYNYNGWMELYNNGTAAVNINGYTFKYTDDDNVEHEATIDYDCTIAKGGYKLIFFDKEEKEGHISYKLDASGGTMVLLDASGATVSTLTVPSICAYVSYGIKGDTIGYMVPTPAAANSTAYPATKLKNFVASHQCDTVKFSTHPGVCNDAIALTMTSGTTGAKIYYTTDGTVPTESNGKLYSKALDITKTTVIRARAYADGKIYSPISTGSYLFNDTKHSYCSGLGAIPVVSIVTDIKNFNDDTYGFAVKGTNGIVGGCSSTGTANYNQPWKRPMNFEFIVDGKTVVSHELEAKIMGGCSRKDDIKSLALCANKKCGKGNNKMEYAFFTDKPDIDTYKSLHLRNGGNDFDGIRIRDGIMQAMIHGNNIDYQAYRPVAYYLNGEYQGLMGLNEHANEDYVYSNYGLDDDEIDLIKIANHQITASNGTVDAYNNLISEAQISQNTDSYCDKMNKLMDIDEYLTYNVFEQFICNTDWPGNNQKLWRATSDGRFRWILYDTDFGFNLYGGAAPNYDGYTTDMIKFCLGEGSVVNWANGSKTSPYTFTDEYKWKTILFSSLMKDDNFKAMFLTKNLMLLQTNLTTERMKAVIDSVASDAQAEYCAMNANANYKPNITETEEISTMKEFAEKRPSYVMQYLASYFGGSQVNLAISSNVAGARFSINGLYWDKDSYEGKYITNAKLTVTPIAPNGYKFKNWKLSSAASANLLNSSSTWNYLYNATGAETGWNTADFETTGWESGNGKFGYASSGDFDTEMTYGEDADDKPITAYFRTTVDVDDVANYSKFVANITYDDAYVIYVNGKEIKRDNLPEEDAIEYSTLATEYTNDATAEVEIASSYFKTGENVIAVEIHQNSATSSDLVFAMTLNAIGNAEGSESTKETYSAVINDNYSMEAIFEKVDNSNTLFINEVCTSNKGSETQGGYADEYGKYGDWIEIYNSGDADINIAGWYLTDNSAKPTKYQIPTNEPNNTIVPAKGYLMIWCDNDIWNGPLHTSFKLGESATNTIVLSKDINGTVTTIDQMEIPASLGTNNTYGRETDGDENLVVFNISDTEEHLIPTPFKANGSESIGENKNVPAIVNGDEHNSFIIYPNPVNEQLNVASRLEDITSIRIYDNTGRLIKAIAGDSNYASIATSDLAQGVYQINIETQNNNVRMKFIKK